MNTRTVSCVRWKTELTDFQASPSPPSGKSWNSWTIGKRTIGADTTLTFHHLPKILVELYRAVDGDSVRERELLDLFDSYLVRGMAQYPNRDRCVRAALIFVRTARASTPGTFLLRHACDKLTRRVKIRFFRRANHPYNSPHPVPEEGALAIVTERWDGMRWTHWHRARDGTAGRDKLRERSSGRADERCRNVRRNRVVPAPQRLASSLWTASRPGRARSSQFSARRRRLESPILRGERAISREPVRRECRSASADLYARVRFLLVHFAHQTAGAARIPAFPAPSI